MTPQPQHITSSHKIKFIHSGSSSWITDASGSVNQHLQYLPFGEDFIYQRNSSWDVPYTFSGKEKDAETGYSYFGARYYSSDLSVWLSVDPMGDMYPSTSPFMYVRGNPVMLVDPKGLEVKHIGNKFWNWVRGHGWEEGKYSGTFYGKQRKLDAKSVANLTTGSFVSKKEYIRYWEKTHAVKMKKAQRKVVPDGCIGLVRADTGTPHDKKPDTSHSYDNLESAEEYAKSLPKGQRVVIFALEFATDKPDRYKGNEKTHRVLIKSQKIYDNSFYNYYLFDPYSGMWWGANQGDPQGTPVGKQVFGGMMIDVNNGQSIKRGVSNTFDIMVFCVTTTNIP